MELEGIVCKRKDSPYHVTEKGSRIQTTSHRESMERYARIWGDSNHRTGQTPKPHRHACGETLRKAEKLVESC